MPLKLSLKPGEKFVLNGAVIQNGDRRGVLVLQNKASILREKDIMQEAEATSPARRVYFPVMMMYLAESEAGHYVEPFALRLQEFASAVRNPAVAADCEGVARHVAAGDFYRALMLCRKLIDYEAGQLNATSQRPAA